MAGIQYDEEQQSTVWLQPYAAQTTNTSLYELFS